jgi:hypothetical protein
MVDDRAPLGFLIAALGAAVLAVSVFLPWYGVSITASGAASAQQEIAAVAQQYGNAESQAVANQIGAEFGSYTGRQLAAVSAHDVLKDVTPILLILAAAALLASLLRLSRAGVFEAGGGQIALAGGAAALFVLYRMLVHPSGERLPDSETPGTAPVRPQLPIEVTRRVTTSRGQSARSEERENWRRRGSPGCEL